MIREAELCTLNEWRQALRHPEGPTKGMRLVLLALSTYGNATGDSMYPSIYSLAHSTDLHHETVRRLLQQAVAAGWVVRHEREGYGRGHRGYSYQAAMPSGWRAGLPGGDLNAWQADPAYISERAARMRRRGSRKQACNVPAPDRDASPHQTGTKPADDDDVPALCGDRPCVALTTSLPGVDDVPVSDRRTFPLTTPKTVPVTAPNFDVTRDAVEAVGSPGRALTRAEGRRLSPEEQTRKAIAVLEAKQDISPDSLLRMYPLADPQAVKQALSGLQGGA